MRRQGWLEFWRYRELFYFFAWRDIKIRYRQTIFGLAWALLQPFFAMLIFTFLLGRWAKLPTDGIPAPIFYYSALLPWLYFASSLNFASNSLVANTELIRKVYFPRASLPASASLVGVLDFAVATLLLFGMMAYYQMPPTWSLLLWPLLLLHLLVLTLGLALFFSALNVRYRDIKHALPFLIQILFFLTPVMYPLSMIPEKYRPLLALNPMTGLIEAFRASLVPSRAVDWHLLAISAAVTTGAFLLGSLYFRKAERAFADVI